MFDKSRQRFVVLLPFVFTVLGFTFLVNAEELASPTLSNYLENDDDSYQWEILSEGKVGETRYAEI